MTGWCCTNVASTALIADLVPALDRGRAIGVNDSFANAGSIFLPLLEPFNVDPIFFGILVALNTQTAFNTPPVAMAAFYLKGVAPPHVTLADIFKGALPFVGMVFLSMVLVYIFPGLVLWLPDYLYTPR